MEGLWRMGERVWGAAGVGGNGGDGCNGGVAVGDAGRAEAEDGDVWQVVMAARDLTRWCLCEQGTREVERLFEDFYRAAEAGERMQGWVDGVVNGAA
jgi:hypothetical protein